MRPRALLVLVHLPPSRLLDRRLSPERRRAVAVFEEGLLWSACLASWPLIGGLGSRACGLRLHWG